VLWRHIAAAGVFASLAVVWTFPLASHLSTHLPGGEFGDNVAFLWNSWWMRMALSSGSDFFHTDLLFVPAGTGLTLHTHTALPAFVGSTLFSGFSVIGAHNLTILVSLFLNGFCAYLLAWRVTRDWGAALVGGLVFGGSPYVSAHLNGHFNLTTAWTIPLFTIAASEAVRGSARSGVLAGLLLGLTAYIDYYYVVFEIVLALCLLAFAARDWSVVLRRSSPQSRRLARIVGILVAIDLALIATIAFTGGFSGPIGPIRSVRGTFNLLQAFWVLLAVLLWLWFRPRVHARRRDSWPARRAAVSLAVVGVIFAATAAPLAWNALGLLLRGEYVSQQYFWRSAPRGVDIATLVLGNPFHPVLRAPVQRVYSVLGLDVIETTGWLGIAPAVLAVWVATRRLRSASSPCAGVTPDTTEDCNRLPRQWAVIGLLFFVWALGPHLMAFGQNTGMILPQALMRYVPLLNNARVPGRAMVVAYLALAVLTAVAAAEWRTKSRRRVLGVLALAFVVIADYLPAPFPLVAMHHPAIYEKLRDRAEKGAVCELPLGLRDGFGERGSFDDRVLFYQTIHQRPLVGGFVARLPPSVLAAYENDPLLAGLLRLSAGDELEHTPPLPDRELALDKLRENGIRFIVLDRGRASPKLIEYVERVLPVSLIAEEHERSLYLVSR
jgi:hypothetical protein